MNLDAASHVGESSRSRGMPDLLSGCVALAEYLLAAGVDRAVRCFVPNLKEATRLYIPPLCVRITVRLAC